MLNLFDVFLLVIIVVSIVRGIKNGFVRGVFGILGIGFGVWLAIRYEKSLSMYLAVVLPLSMNIVKVVSFILIFLVVVISFNFAGIGIRKLLSSIQLDWFDNFGGGVLGLVLSFVWISLLLTLIVFLPIPASWKTEVHDSYIVTIYMKHMPDVVRFLGGFLPAGLQGYLAEWQRLLASGI